MEFRWKFPGGGPCLGPAPPPSSWGKWVLSCSLSWLTLVFLCFLSPSLNNLILASNHTLKEIIRSILWWSISFSCGETAHHEIVSCFWWLKLSEWRTLALRLKDWVAILRVEIFNREKLRSLPWRPLIAPQDVGVEPLLHSFPNRSFYNWSKCPFCSLQKGRRTIGKPLCIRSKFHNSWVLFLWYKLHCMHKVHLALTASHWAWRTHASCSVSKWTLWSLIRSLVFLLVIYVCLCTYKDHNTDPSQFQT